MDWDRHRPCQGLGRRSGRGSCASRILSDLVDRGILVKTSTASRGPSVRYGPGAKFPTGRRVRRKPGDDPSQSPLET